MPEDRGVAATLVERIRKDLLHRLAGGEKPDLRLEALAKGYNASTRPVRLALAELGRSGVLAQEDNGRWRVARAPRKAAPPPAEDDAEARLRKLIVQRALAGDAGFLREEETAESLRIGRGQLRRLLAELTGKGIVVHEPRRGWRARPATQEDFDAFLDVREALELLALDLAMPRLDDAVLAEFEAANVGGVDNRLHGYFIAQSRNPYIADFFTRHGPYFDLLFTWEAHDAVQLRQAGDHHLAILRALRAKNRDAARAALSEHIRGNHLVLNEVLRRK
jgi:DNA-binding GntR family transcriptional regulator